MKKISKEDNETCCGADKKLNAKELQALSVILEAIENKEYSLWRHLNGGFAEAQMFNYDNDQIDFQLEYGEQDMGCGFSSRHTESGQIPRDILLKKMPLEKKLKAIHWGN